MTPVPFLHSLACLLAGLWLCVPDISDAAEQGLCDTSLSNLSWTLQQDGQYGHLNSDRSGKELHGVSCREADIIDWFQANGWEHRTSVSPQGALFGHGLESYPADRGLVFCLPRSFLLRWRTNGCLAQVGVLLFQGKITRLTAGPTV